MAKREHLFTTGGNVSHYGKLQRRFKKTEITPGPSDPKMIDILRSEVSSPTTFLLINLDPVITKSLKLQTAPWFNFPAFVLAWISGQKDLSPSSFKTHS